MGYIGLPQGHRNATHAPIRSYNIVMRALLSLLAGLALIYVSFGVVLYLFQGSMVYLAKLPG